MKSFIIFLIPVLLLTQDIPMTLDDLKWKHRVVLYFPDKDDGGLILSDSIHQEIQDRKIAYFIFGDSIVSNIDYSFSPNYIQQIENKYKMGNKQTMYVLLGLDGGVKVKNEEVIDWKYIFRTIDAMPMRQSEKSRDNR